MRELLYVERCGIALYVGLLDQRVPWKWYGNGFQWGRVEVQWG